MRLRLGFVAILSLCVGVPCAAAQDRSLEYTVKAAFLYRFGSFVDWPAGTFAGPRAPVQICLVGHDPFGTSLDAVIAGQTINARPIALRRIGSISRTSGCHIAYLGGGPDQSVAAAMRAVSDAPVLTVAEAGAGERAAVQFVLRANRVRFQIDQAAAAKARLTISSKLLNLAVKVTQ